VQLLKFFASWLQKLVQNACRVAKLLTVLDSLSITSFFKFGFDLTKSFNKSATLQDFELSLQNFAI